MISNIFSASLTLLQSKLECLSLQSFFKTFCVFSASVVQCKKSWQGQTLTYFMSVEGEKKCFIILALGGPLARVEPARQGL
jgi:hypothetical protein